MSSQAVDPAKPLDSGLISFGLLGWLGGIAADFEKVSIQAPAEIKPSFRPRWPAIFEAIAP